jgi:hypothetical protein
MAFKPRSDDERARAITRLVDDSLGDIDRGGVEAWAAQTPEVGREVARQRRVARDLRIGGPDVPERLLDAIQTRVRTAVQPGAQRSRPRRRLVGSGWRPAVAATGLLALATIAVVLAITTSSGPGTPTIPAAAKLAFAPATQPAPAAKSPKLLDVSYAGITYPNYAPQFGAVPTGQRVDRIGGRPALTVFYRLRDGARLSYTVFSGRPVPLPSAARSVLFDGVHLRVFSTASRLSVVTLVRFGRTCVLAAPTSHAAVLALAAAPIKAQAD